MYIMYTQIQKIVSLLKTKHDSNTERETKHILNGSHCAVVLHLSSTLAEIHVYTYMYVLAGRVQQKTQV